MRDAFISELLVQAKKDPSIILITGDLGFKVFDEYRESLPEQFLNAGIAEQNMIGLASGLAFEGWKPVVYSIANFPSLRALEQIRNNVCYHNLNVKIVSVGAGFSYGQLGSSHHATEDISALRVIPNLKIFSPGSTFESVKCTRFMIDEPGPAYLRIDRGGSKEDLKQDFKFLDSRTLRKGKNITFLVTGGIVTDTMKAADLLDASVISFPTISPLKLPQLNKDELLVTVEEHSVNGGFGSAVLERLNDEGYAFNKLLRLGVPGVFSDVVGDQDYLRKLFKIDCDSIVKRVKDAQAEL